MAKKQALVVYYSRSGTTRIFARALATELGGDIEEIRDAKERKGLAGYWRSMREAIQTRPGGILPAARNPLLYDLVLIGTPVWGWSVSSRVRAYLLANRISFPDVAFFCTSAGTGAARTFFQMQLLTGSVPRSVLAVSKHEVISDRCGRRLAIFIDEVRSAYWGSLTASSLKLRS